MTIHAKIIAHSRPAFGNIPDLITFQLRYPRLVHSEVMTHRVFSRNASSSRAIPVKRLIEDVLSDTAMPIHWGRNQKGMQAFEENSDLIYHEAVSPFDVLEARFEGVTAEQAWRKARDNAVAVARAFAGAEYHKQIVNRLLEPFSHINVVVTASNYDNFLHLRRHPDAQPEIKALADRMWEALQDSTPEVLEQGEWHTPYAPKGSKRITAEGEETLLTLDQRIKCSVSRCARVSYLTHDGRIPALEEDLELYDRLLGSQPLHASPAEHQAQFMINSNGLNGNFAPGYIQYRKTLPGEYCTQYVPHG